MIPLSSSISAKAFKAFPFSDFLRSSSTLTFFPSLKFRLRDQSSQALDFIGVNPGRLRPQFIRGPFAGTDSAPYGQNTQPQNLCGPGQVHQHFFFSLLFELDYYCCIMYYVHSQIGLLCTVSEEAGRTRVGKGEIFMKKLPEFVRDPFGLKQIAVHLNKIPDMGGKMAEVWKKAEWIIKSLVDPLPVRNEIPPRSLQSGRLFIRKTLLGGPPTRKLGLIRWWRAAKMDFNGWAEENPVPLSIELDRSPENKIEFKTGVSHPDDAQFAIYLLWLYFFKDRGWERLKRCPQCGKWFVDTSSNKNKSRCSMECTWKWWDRPKRKEAGHGRKKGGKKPYKTSPGKSRGPGR